MHCTHTHTQYLNMKWKRRNSRLSQSREMKRFFWCVVCLFIGSIRIVNECECGLCLINVCVVRHTVIPSYGTFYMKFRFDWPFGSIRWLLFAGDNVCTIIPPAPIALVRRIRYFRHLINDDIECHRSAPHRMLIICQAFFGHHHISIWTNSFVSQISVPLIKLIKLLRNGENSEKFRSRFSNLIYFLVESKQEKTVHFNGSIRIYYSVIGIHLVHSILSWGMCNCVGRGVK